MTTSLFASLWSLLLYSPEICIKPRPYFGKNPCRPLSISSSAHVSRESRAKPASVSATLWVVTTDVFHLPPWKVKDKGDRKCLPNHARIPAHLGIWGFFSQSFGFGPYASPTLISGTSHDALTSGCFPRGLAQDVHCGKQHTQRTQL